MIRNADKITRNADNAVLSETFELGHWEAMQISVALASLAEAMPEGMREHTSELSRIFGLAETTFTVTRNQTYVD